jgi:ubiquinone/menaquinone biosynthesis C-methylase UbiE
MYVRLIHWAFERFYREFAWTYDVVAALVSWGRWRRWTLAALPALSGDILELGCGTGNLQAALAEASHSDAIASVIGIDASRQMLALTRRKAPHACLACADAGALPFAQARFDCVVATFPTEYIAAAPTLAEVRRVLRPGGRLLIILGAQLSGPPLYQNLVVLAYRLLLMNPPATQQPSGSASSLLEAISQIGMSASDAWIAGEGGWIYIITAIAK